MAAPELTALLDDRRLTGDVEVRGLLGPAQGALVLADDDFATALNAIEGLSQTWGGACHRVYAVRRGEDSLPSLFYDDQRAARVSSVGGCEALDPAVVEEEHRDLMLWKAVGIGESLFAALIAAGDSKDWKVSASVVSPDDPWALAYAAVLGSLPDVEMNPHEMQAHGFRTDLRWRDIIDVEFDQVEKPSSGDLVNRLRELERFSPARLSRALLSIPFVGPNSGIFMGDSPLPTPHARKHMVGPNLVVVYEPEAISDLALIWNLRAAHGLPPGLPLAVPATESILSDLRDLLAVHPQANFGIGGDRAPRLISTSVPQQTLEEIAAQTDPFVAGDWREFREIPLRPGRTRRELLPFAEGRARMSSWAPQDRIQLGSRPSHSRRPDLKFTIAPVTQPLPHNDSLRPEWAHQDGWREWGYQTDDRGPDDLVTVRWPSGWDVLERLLNDRGLHAQPSTAGKVAASFLTRLGSFHQLGMLLDTQVLAQIYDLGTAKAMTWFRKRARDIAEASRRPGEDESAIQAIERTLSELTLRPDDEDQPLATIETVRKLFANDREAARAWIRWAEASDLLVRGARVKCSDCSAESWRQMGELAPPVTCRGCGKTIDHPYPEGELKFFYRASEPLLRAVDQDVLPHLLALRFFCELWQPKFDQPSALYGGHPGVDIYEFGSDTRLAEADVLLVMSNGDLIPGECKRTGAGLNSTEIGKLEELAHRLGSPWSFVATMDWAADCPTIWSESIRFAPEPHPRFALTAEHLLTPHVFWPGGSNPFEWDPADTDTRDEHHTQFVQTVPHWTQMIRG